MQWLVQWLNMSPEEGTWEDADFIKRTFPEFFNNTIRSWFPPKDPGGQGSSSEGGNCQDPASLHCLTEERDNGSEEIDSETESVFTWEMDDPDEAIGRSTAQLLSCSQSRCCRHSLESHNNGTGRDRPCQLLSSFSTPPEASFPYSTRCTT